MDGNQPGNAGAVLGVEAQVQHLLTADKCKQAVELAKDHHKRVNTADSQRLLVQAYLARIVQFQNKHMDQEAQTLLTLVQQRFPSERQQLRGMEIRAAAAAGRWQELLAPLAVAQTSAETREAIEMAVRRYITDLPALAACAVLPAEHPLRLGAAAVWRAFLAVTKGPVTEAEVALPEVSHRSPLAAWKMLIRAIAAFYRQDDLGCRRALDAIPADAAVVRLAATVRGMIDGIKPLGGIALALHERVMADDQALRAALRKVEASYEYYDPARLQSGVRDAVHLCATYRPDLLERLRQHITVNCLLRNVLPDTLFPLVGITAANAYFWQLLARMGEVRLPEVAVAIYWERFVRHADHEKLFSATGVEAATVWLHIADLLARLSLRRLARDRRRLDHLCRVSIYYTGQPPEIAALRPASDEALADEVLTPGRAFQHAARIRPDAETFRSWWAWAQRMNLPDKQKEDVLLEWQRNRPGDVQPPVDLALLAEARNALSLAMKRLSEAEAIDPLNQQVRQARVRLTLAITRRHFTDGKAHLVEKDLAELAALPGMNEGDRAGVLESLRCYWQQLRRDEAAAEACFAALVQRMGMLAASILSASVNRFLGITGKNDPVRIPAEAAPLDVAQTQARLERLTAGLGINLLWPHSWIAMIVKLLRQEPCPLSTQDLLALGSAALNMSAMDMAYLASAAGLGRTESPAMTARFLLLRAKSLNQPWQRRRTVQCLRAALELARQAHDETLLRDVFATIDGYPSVRRMLAYLGNAQGLEEPVLRAVLHKERQATGCPRTSSGLEAYVVAGVTENFGGVFGPYADAYQDSDIDDEDDDDEYDEDDEFDEDDFGVDEFGNDYDEDEDDENDPGLFDLDSPARAYDLPRDGPSPQDLAQIARELENKGINSPEQVMADPMALIEAMAKAMGQTLTPAQKREMVEKMDELLGNIPGSPPPGFFDGESKKKKRKRRGRS